VPPPIIHCLKGKGKVHPRTGHEGPQREYRYNYFFFNLGARWGGWSKPRPGRFTPGKETQHPLYRRLGGPQSRTERVLQVSAKTRFPKFDAICGNFYCVVSLSVSLNEECKKATESGLARTASNAVTLRTSNSCAQMCP
jgi:hypothetical protein